MTDHQQQLRQLKEQTGVGYAECERVLIEAHGDVDCAVGLLRGRGTIYTVEARDAFEALLETNPDHTEKNSRSE